MCAGSICNENLKNRANKQNNLADDRQLQLRKYYELRLIRNSCKKIKKLFWMRILRGFIYLEMQEEMEKKWNRRSFRIVIGDNLMLLMQKRNGDFKLEGSKRRKIILKNGYKNLEKVRITSLFLVIPEGGNDVHAFFDDFGTVICKN